MQDSGIIKEELLKDLCDENEEIIKIMVVARKNSEGTNNWIID